MRLIRAFRLTEWGAASLESVPIAEPVQQQVQVRVEAAGICRSDIHLIDQGPDVASFDPPFTLGHELCGTVSALGPKALGLEIGERVTAPPIWGCGICSQCARGSTNYCAERLRAEGGKARYPMGGGLGLDGSLAEYVLVSRSDLLVPVTARPEHAAVLTDAGLTAYGAIRRYFGRVAEHDSFAAVIGIGGLGHLAVGILRVLTRATVIAVDVAQDRKALALSMGAHHFVVNGLCLMKEFSGITGGRGVDLVIDCVGNQGTLEIAAAIASVDSAIAILGVGGGALRVSLGSLSYGCSISGHSAGSVSELRELVKLMQTGLLQPSVEAFSLSEVALAIDRVKRGAVYGRAVIHPDTGTRGT